jgi:hypothetical protein
VITKKVFYWDVAFEIRMFTLYVYECVRNTTRCRPGRRPQFTHHCPSFLDSRDVVVIVVTRYLNEENGAIQKVVNAIDSVSFGR